MESKQSKFPTWLFVAMTITALIADGLGFISGVGYVLSPVVIICFRIAFYFMGIGKVNPKKPGADAGSWLINILFVVTGVAEVIPLISEVLPGCTAFVVTIFVEVRIQERMIKALKIAKPLVEKLEKKAALVEKGAKAVAVVAPEALAVAEVAGEVKVGAQAANKALEGFDQEESAFEDTGSPLAGVNEEEPSKKKSKPDKSKQEELKSGSSKPIPKGPKPAPKKLPKLPV